MTSRVSFQNNRLYDSIVVIAASFETKSQYKLSLIRCFNMSSRVLSQFLPFHLTFELMFVRVFYVLLYSSVLKRFSPIANRLISLILNASLCYFSEKCKVPNISHTCRNIS